MDLSDLLVDSRRLAGSDVETAGRGLRRGIAELQEASRHLAGDERQTKTLRSIDDIAKGIQWKHIRILLISYRGHRTIDYQYFTRSDGTRPCNS